MKAITYTEYGPPDVLHITDLPKPVPQDNEILIRIYATPVSFGDITARRFNEITPAQFSMPMPLWLISRLQFGINTPKKRVLGSEFAGVVEAIGSAVTRFQPGDEVFGYRGADFGANAEYLCVAEDTVVAHKPANVTLEEAATIPYGALTALNLLKRIDIKPGDKVLINGASGGIGSYALQLAKHYGAEVTGVCSTPRVETVRKLGADHVIDYTQENFTQNGETYDLILDILGKSSFEQVKGSLAPDGRYLLASFKIKQLLQMLWTSFTSRKKVICALAIEKPDDLLHIKELVEAGALTTIIDRRYPLEEAAEAHRYIEQGHKTGHVLLMLAPGT